MHMPIPRKLALLLTVGIIGTEANVSAPWSADNLRPNSTIVEAHFAEQALADRVFSFLGSIKPEPRKDFSFLASVATAIPPDKGVGPPDELSKDLEAVIKRAKEAGGLHFESMSERSELERFTREATAHAFQTIRNIHWMGPTIDELETTLREASIILVRDPLRPNMPVLTARGWHHLAAAHWRWNPTEKKGTIFLPTVLVRDLLERDGGKGLISLVGFETYKLASDRFHSDLSGEVVERLARALELEIATESAADGHDLLVSPAEQAIASVLQQYLELTGLPNYVLVAIHLSPQYENFGAKTAGRLVQRLIELPTISAVFEKIYIPHQHSEPRSASYLIHAGHKVTDSDSKDMFPWMIKKYQKFIFTGGMFEQCLHSCFQELIEKFISIESGQIEVHLPSQGPVYSNFDRAPSADKEKYYVEILNKSLGEPFNEIAGNGFRKRFYRNSNGATLRFIVWESFQSLLKLLESSASKVDLFDKARGTASRSDIALTAPSVSYSASHLEQALPESTAIRRDDEGFIGDRQRYLQNANYGRMPSELSQKQYVFEWPVDMKDSRMHVTAVFDGRNYSGPYHIEHHMGIDIQTPADTEVRTVEDGVVVFLHVPRVDPKAQHLVDVFIYSKQSNLMWIYVHMQEDSLPRKIREHKIWGRYSTIAVKAGEAIGKVGKWHSPLTAKVLVPEDVREAHGRSYNHLHLEVHYVPGQEHSLTLDSSGRDPLNPLLLLRRLYDAPEPKNPGCPSHSTPRKYGHSPDTATSA